LDWFGGAALEDRIWDGVARSTHAPRGTRRTTHAPRAHRTAPRTHAPRTRTAHGEDENH